MSKKNLPRHWEITTNSSWVLLFLVLPQMIFRTMEGVFESTLWKLERVQPGLLASHTLIYHGGRVNLRSALTARLFRSWLGRLSRYVTPNPVIGQVSILGPSLPHARLVSFRHVLAAFFHL